MKYLRQFCIILLISALGEGLHILLPLPVPASVYGLVLMLGALTSGILKLEQVEDASYYDLQSVGYILQHYCNTMVSSFYQNEAKERFGLDCSVFCAFHFGICWIC